MKIFTFFIPIFIYASTLLNINYFENPNKVDILLSLEQPFNGKIKLKGDKTLIITNIYTNTIERKSFKNSFLKNLIIAPESDNSIKITFFTDYKLKFQAAKTAGGYGLRIRVLPKQQTNTYNPSATTNNQNNNMNTFENQQKNEMPQINENEDIINIWAKYLIAVIFIAILIAIWVLIKKRFANVEVSSTIIPPKNVDGVKTLFIHQLDPQNKIIAINFDETTYLLLIGQSGNLLLDVIDKDGKRKTEFNQILQENETKLNNLFSIDNLDEYKQKASKLSQKEYDEL